jgi:hypothetical protein
VGSFPEGCSDCRSDKGHLISNLLGAVDRQLLNQPNVETKNRKPMRPNPVAPWELRIGSLRGYYDVEEYPETKVIVAAVGVKERNRVRIGGEIIDL